MPVCLFVCLYVFLFVCLYVFLFVCLSDFTLCLLICLSVCLSVYLPSCLSACLLICLSGFLYVCLLICLYILFVCHPICLSVSFWKVLHSRVGSALPANLRQGWKILPGANTLDYYENSRIADKRTFITLAPCSLYNTKKTFFSSDWRGGCLASMDRSFHRSFSPPPHLQLFRQLLHLLGQ